MHATTIDPNGIVSNTAPENPTSLWATSGANPSTGINSVAAKLYITIIPDIEADTPITMIEIKHRHPGKM